MKKNTSLLFFFKHNYIQLYIHVFSLLHFLFSENTNKSIPSSYLKKYYSEMFRDITQTISSTFIDLLICQSEKTLIRHCSFKNNSHNFNRLLYHV